jgi:hypothetical protein
MAFTIASPVQLAANFERKPTTSTSLTQYSRIDNPLLFSRARGCKFVILGSYGFGNLENQRHRVFTRAKTATNSNGSVSEQGIADRTASARNGGTYATVPSTPSLETASHSL